MPLLNLSTSFALSVEKIMVTNTSDNINFKDNLVKNINTYEKIKYKNY